MLRKIFKDAGYKWRKAREVLTSKDPDYRQKVDQIHKTLGRLRQDEGFYSIDEFGPFAVKHRKGRKLVAPGEDHVVQQWQKSKGALIITAAVELQTNQVTHFYSKKKNTDEMIKLLDLLLTKNRHLSKIYLSWDAASWHVSKKLHQHIETNHAKGLIQVEIAPLPAGAQFLNVIEAVFSGMARAVLHNSDYKSIVAAKGAIDRYFDERNQRFLRNPKRAGNKIWGPSRFNHKEPKISLSWALPPRALTYKWFCSGWLKSDRRTRVRLSGAGESRHGWYQIAQLADIRKLCKAAVVMIKLAHSVYAHYWPLPAGRRSAAFRGTSAEPSFRSVNGSF